MKPTTYLFVDITIFKSQNPGRSGTISRPMTVTINYYWVYTMYHCEPPGSEGRPVAGICLCSWNITRDLITSVPWWALTSHNVSNLLHHIYRTGNWSHYRPLNPVQIIWSCYYSVNPGIEHRCCSNSLLADNQLTDRGRVDNCFVIECQHIASCCLVVDACDIVSVFVHTLWCVQRPPGRGETPEAARPGRPGHGVIYIYICILYILLLLL